MNPILEKIIFAAIGVLVPALIAWLGTQINKYKKLAKQEEDLVIKNTIVNTLNESLSPIQTNINTLTTDIGDLKNDVGNMKNDIAKLQTSEINFTTRLNPMQDEIEHLKDDIQEILNDLKAQGIDLDHIREREELLAHETRCAWRYRIRQLCHVYIARGYMSFEEYSQLQEMYKIYTAIGGNGQTKELYDMVISSVKILTDIEIAAMARIEEQ